MTIYNNNYGVYISPLKEDVKDFFKAKQIANCFFQINRKYLTDHYIQANDTIKKTNFSFLKERDILLFGGEGQTFFEIYKVKKQIYIKHKGKIDRFGRFQLSSELGRYFKNWFRDELFVVMHQDRKTIICSKVQRRISTKKITKVLHFHYYGEPKELEIIMTNPALEFNERTLRDLNIKLKLVNAGFKISAFNSYYRPENEHKDKSFEKRVKKLLVDCFKKVNKTSILPEVRIKPILIPNMEDYQEYMCIDVVIPLIDSLQKKSNLLLIEIKTGDSKGKIVKGVEHDIARLLYLKSKLGNPNVIPIVVFNDDIKINNSITTKEFGMYARVILIGFSEFQLLEKEPTHLLDRINEFKNECLPLEKNSIFENSDIEIIGNRVSNHQGSEFESYVSDVLKSENFQVISNVLIRCCGKEFEIDHLATKNGRTSIVSCKDRSNWKSTTLKEEIKKYLIILLFRKGILGTHKGRLYVKTKNKIIVKTL